MGAGWLRKVVIAIHLLASCLLAAHAVNAGIEYALISHWQINPAPVKVDTADNSSPIDDPTHVQSLETMKQVILTSGLFQIPPVITETERARQEQEQALPPLNLKLKFKLKGTAFGEPGRAMAILEEVASKRQLIYRLGDQIPGGGELVEIQKTGVRIQDGSRQELLELSLQDDAQGQPIPVVSAPVSRDPTQLRKILDRREVDAAVSDLNKLLSEARAYPFFRNGKVIGYEVTIMNPESFYARIGLIPGDVLTRVNGHEVRDPGQVFSLIQQTKNERTVKLDLLRHGQTPTTLVYEIR